VNIIEILDASTIDWKDTPDPDEIRVCCPFCIENDESPDTRYRLGINVRLGRAHCFNCRWRSDHYVHIARELARAGDVNMLGTSVTAEKPKDIKPKSSPTQEYLTDMPGGYEVFNWQSEFERPARHYLMNRGITKDQIARWKIGWAMTGDYAGRVIIPVMMDGELAGVVGRDYTGKSSLRYRNSKSLRGVFGAKGNHVAVMSEGPMDALRIEPLVMGEDSIALFGSNISEDQLQFLKRYTRITYICDQDAPGCKGARLNCAAMATAGINILVSVPEKLDGTDPGSQSDELLLRRRRTARPWSSGVERLLKHREAFT
jgi:DNA primase